MLTRAQVQAVLDEVEYLDWEFVLLEDARGNLFLQIQFDAPDTTNPNGDLERQYCRKWYIDQEKPAPEVAQTAWAAVQMAVLHEARECFRYKGYAIYGPHFNADEQVAAMRREEKNARLRLAYGGSRDSEVAPLA